MVFRADGQILQAVRLLADSNEELLAAVAFWGRRAGQQTGITGRTAPTRILCDLLSGACNPAEISHLLDNDVEVKYRPHLHAKVWVSGNEVLVGSANASMALVLRRQDRTSRRRFIFAIGKRQAMSESGLNVNGNWRKT